MRIAADKRIARTHSITQIVLLCTAILTPVTIHAQGLPAGLPSLQSVIERQNESAREQAAERAREQASDRAREQAAETALQRSAERATEQAAGRVAEQAVERAQGAAGQVQGQIVERVQGRATQSSNRAGERANERTLEAASDRAQAQTARLPAVIDGVGQGAASAAPAGSSLLPQANTTAREQSAGRAAGLANAPAATGLPARNPISLLPPLPDRLEIADAAGGTAWVEVTIEPNIRVREREWIMMLNNEQLVQLQAEGSALLPFLVRTDELPAFNRRVLIFSVPPDLDSDSAIRELVPENLRPLIDRNHIYQAQSRVDSIGGVLPLPMQSVCENPISVGMIDSAVDTQHPAFTRGGRAAPFVQRSFTDQDLSSPPAHGTAVAGVLVGDGDGLNPLLPNGTVYSGAVVYAQDDYRQASSVLGILRALDWLLDQPLTVINISLAGPHNRLLEEGVVAATARGKLLVAAAGNNGPFAPAAYPAAYPDVVTVTAVSRDMSVYRWANQGHHVDFAAFGVQIPTAVTGGQVGAQSGTSLAAPVVSAFLACALIETEGDSAQALDLLKQWSLDLGEEGHDPVYGYGLLHP